MLKNDVGTQSLVLKNPARYPLEWSIAIDTSMSDIFSIDPDFLKVNLRFELIFREHLKDMNRLLFLFCLNHVLQSCMQQKRLYQQILETIPFQWKVLEKTAN